MKANRPAPRADAVRGARPSARKTIASRAVRYAKENPWKTAGLGAIALGAGVGAYALLRRRGRKSNASANPGNPGNGAGAPRKRSARDRAG